MILGVRTKEQLQSLVKHNKYVLGLLVDLGQPIATVAARSYRTLCSKTGSVLPVEALEADDMLGEMVHIAVTL